MTPSRIETSSQRISVVVTISEAIFKTTTSVERRSKRRISSKTPLRNVQAEEARASAM